MLHGAGPRLEGLVRRTRALAAALGDGTRLLDVDAARSVGAVAGVLRLLGERPFGYDPLTLSRSDYDRRAPGRVVGALAAHRAAGGGPALLVGHSLGAAMAVEVVERAAERGLALDGVLLLDRMFFEWRWGAFFGIRPRRPRLTPRGAGAVGDLVEVLVDPANLPLVERVWVSLPAGGHAPLDAAVAAHARRHRRLEAPAAYGHAAVVDWALPYGLLARPHRGARGAAP